MLSLSLGILFGLMAKSNQVVNIVKNTSCLYIIGSCAGHSGIKISNKNAMKENKIS